MKTGMSFVLLMFTVFLITPASITESVAPVMCVTGTFTADTRAFIVCLFNRDINATKHNFNLVQYTGEGQSGNHVVLCNWRVGDLACNFAAGYSFQHSVSDRVTVQIDRVSSPHIGKYACQILPDDGIPVQTCDLDLTEPLPIVTEPCAADVPPNSQEQENCPGIVPLAVIIALLTCIIGACIAVIFIRKRRLNQWRYVCDLGGCCHQKNILVQDDQSCRTEAEGGSLLVLSQQEDDIATSRPTSCGISAAGQGCKSNTTDRDTQTDAKRKRNQSTQVQHKKEDYAVEDWTKMDVREWLMEKASNKYNAVIDKGFTGAQLLVFNHQKAIKKEFQLDKILTKPTKAAALKNHINELILENIQRKEAWEKMKLERRSDYEH